ncbi:MAG: hypothetical protein H6R07_1363 [Proteobacteria bacterium]|nr:hypothetical protein [Pseudomonadota bacterium]
MQNLSIKLMLATLGISVVLVGCVEPAPVLDSKFGEAFNTAKAQQTLNPDASMNKAPVTGLDGKGADAVVDKYHKSFEAPPAPANTFTIGVGSGSGAK